MNNISGQTQKLHDLIYCRQPNSTWESGRSRASMYFHGSNPTGEEALLLADTTAGRIAIILRSLPHDSPYRSQCEYALHHCGYGADGKKDKK